MPGLLIHMQFPQLASLAIVAAAASLFALRCRRVRSVVGQLCQSRPVIAYLNTEPAEKWKDQLQVFARALSLPLSCFEVFDCFNGEFPTTQAYTLSHGTRTTGSACIPTALHSLCAGALHAFRIEQGRYVGAIITGSAHSARSPDLPWLEGLFECLRTCATVPSLNVIGCCFGCQVSDQ